MLCGIRRLTLTEGRDYPATWTADSKAVIFVSNRNGQSEIFRQSLGDEDTHAIATLSEGGDERPSAGLLNRVAPRMSPDGSWVLYMVWRRAPGFSAPVQLMRVPILGGPPQLVLTTALDIIHSMRCARSRASLCAIAERSSDRTQLIFTAFDPVLGRGRELTRFDTNPTPDAEYVWDLSPDGTRIAILKRSEAAISVLSLSGQPLQEVVVKGWPSLQSVDWLADGTGLFVSSVREGGATLLRLDLGGNAHLLWESKGTIQPEITPFIGGPSAPWAVPSPDGRHLAICEWSLSANIWMLENF
jgi:eukaryotic-like serine/threonine-protein kinase